MCTYLKNMGGFTHNQLKKKRFDEVQKAFDNIMSWIDSFIPMDSKVVKGSKDREKGSDVRAEGSETIAQKSLKRAGNELEQEKTKKQQIDDDQEEAEMRKLIEIVSNKEEVAIDAIPLATKPPSIIDYKIIKEGKISIYQIIRADGSSKRHGYTRPKEEYERVLWGDLKTMFEPDLEMLNKKLQADHWNEMCYQLLKLITKHLKNQ
ncbi:hypothetical protein Tco_0054368 [Tanacetum coccineum]